MQLLTSWHQPKCLPSIDFSCYMSSNKNQQKRQKNNCLLSSNLPPLKRVIWYAKLGSHRFAFNFMKFMYYQADSPQIWTRKTIICVSKHLLTMCAPYLRNSPGPKCETRDPAPLRVQIMPVYESIAIFLRNNINSELNSRKEFSSLAVFIIETAI